MSDDLIANGIVGVERYLAACGKHSTRPAISIISWFCIPCKMPFCPMTVLRKTAVFLTATKNAKPSQGKSLDFQGKTPAFLFAILPKPSVLLRGVRICCFHEPTSGYLRLCTWCKDLPAPICRNILADVLDWLEGLSFIRRAESGHSFRITPEGWLFWSRQVFLPKLKANIS